MIEVSLAGRRRLLFLSSFSFLFIIAWGIRRITETGELVRGKDQYPFIFLLLFIFVWVSWQLWFSWRERAVCLSEEEQKQIDTLTVCINVPAHNEDPALLEKTIMSIFAQTRKPDYVGVVDDGSEADYSKIKNLFEELLQEKQIEGSWKRSSHLGKRYAQMRTFKNHPADIFITVDSDTVLHRRAIEEGLKPFIDPQIKSVAGVILALNKHKNFLTMIEDLVVTSWQLTMRSACSCFGNVIVNCGPFALYRAEIVREAADGYLNETICGREVRCSDDSQLTLYALMRGKTIQQPSAVAFSAWPETFSHHIRQQMRWCRGSFIRTLWRFRYLPLNRPAFWICIFGWTQFIGTTGMFAYLFLVNPELGKALILPTLIVSSLLSYITTIRVLLIDRSDESWRQQLLVYSLSPCVILWAWFIYRPLRIWGALTFLRLGWGTREKVEVGLSCSSVEK